MTSLLLEYTASKSKRINSEHKLERNSRERTRNHRIWCSKYSVLEIDGEGPLGPPAGVSSSKSQVEGPLPPAPLPIAGIVMLGDKQQQPPLEVVHLLVILRNTVFSRS